MKKITAFLIALGLIFTLFQACKKDTPLGPTQYSKVNISLTDATGPYEEVNVDIQQVEIHSTGGGWQTLSILNPGVYNLLDYCNGLDTLILSDSLPVGKISQIRLILGSNNTVKVGGVTYPLATPSAQQSGLKLQIHQDLVAGTTYAITLDFDAAKSVVKTGNGSYILKPVIRAITEIANVGGIKGTVSPAVVTPVFAIMGTDTTGGFTNANGEFLIQSLAPGTYTVLITPAPPQSNDTIYNVVVAAGQITDTGTSNL